MADKPVIVVAPDKTCMNEDGFIRANTNVILISDPVMYEKMQAVLEAWDKDGYKAVVDLNRLQADNANLKEAIAAALRIKELWLPAEAPVAAVHKAEAQTLYKMYDMFEQALKEPTEEIGVEGKRREIDG